MSSKYNKCLYDIWPALRAVCKDEFTHHLRVTMVMDLTTAIRPMDITPLTVHVWIFLLSPGLCLYLCLCPYPCPGLASSEETSVKIITALFCPPPP